MRHHNYDDDQSSHCVDILNPFIYMPDISYESLNWNYNHIIYYNYVALWIILSKQLAKL